MQFEHKEEERDKRCLMWDREWVLDEVSSKLGLERWVGFRQEEQHCPSRNPWNFIFTFFFYFHVSVFFTVFFSYFYFPSVILVRHASLGKQEVKSHGNELHCRIYEWVLAVCIGVDDQ